MNGTKLTISEKVWRKGWRREAAATQAASVRIARLLTLFSQHGFDVHDIRRIAMELGARRAVVKFQAALRRGCKSARQK
jgi:hypothetical protein